MSRGRLHAGPTTDESEVSPPSSGAQAPSTCAPEVHLASAPTSASARSTTTSRRRGCRQNRCFDSPPCGRAQLRAASAGFCPPKTQRRASKPDSTMATAHRPQGVSVYGLKPMHVHDYNLPYRCCAASLEYGFECFECFGRRLLARCLSVSQHAIKPVNKQQAEAVRVERRGANRGGATRALGCLGGIRRI